MVVNDLEDRDYSDDPLDTNDIDWWAGSDSEERFGRIVTRGIVDDVRVYVTTDTWEGNTLGFGGMLWFRPETGFPINGTVVLSEDFLAEEPPEAVLSTMVHELGHVLGIGKGETWDARLRNPSENINDADTFFSGTLARLAFRAAGGTWYRNSRRGVPVENQGDDAHWRESIFGNEVMTPRGSGHEPLSLITIQALADMGYEVDASQAEPYKVPPRGAAKVVAAEFRWRCGVGTIRESQNRPPRPGGEF